MERHIVVDPKSAGSDRRRSASLLACKVDGSGGGGDNAHNPGHLKRAWTVGMTAEASRGSPRTRSCAKVCTGRVCRRQDPLFFPGAAVLQF